MCARPPGEPRLLFREGKKMHYNRYDACDVRHGSIRSVLTDEQLRKLEGASRWQSFNAGEPI
ncbi:MAG: hypothetical protein ACLPKH_00380, partial [Rhodomicrobium sp.]